MSTYPLDSRVLLRNGQHAVIGGRADCGVFKLRGHIEELPQPTPDFWTEDGFWTEQKTPHRLDIIGIYLNAGALVRHLPTTGGAEGQP